ncbi:photosynthetic complex assembly protein PuhC [Lutimaribacter sp. EGI FJ00015]|uniref:Photosynthetic complex assembly protein PuhC n=1 Tax=Lutimaribacter degradans TaxID=2945989 RepID=A0ACC5ZUS2_9RHOB|nr:photosynthetic complex assembly protein PuhC [Lutimaribacter sp. EGI FJ00013]MCM2562052.1 photosynthetic complex assembly protein PuhC [Lutimaribacter sp. EGI FJ00013]MCO0615081.1 photosynthetic complex assembly protein PuhC [Lutimaribacter sp. EGI FJ00015]MCO0635884.1 photosynthetic complex assembly protein PuhC [Lutimaribacter sp. EGI FJ00014]
MQYQSAHSSHRPSEPEKIPPVLLRGVAFLIVASMTIVTSATISGRPATSTPPVSKTVAETAFVLDAEMSGAVRITTPDGTLIADLAPEAGGFISGVARVIEFNRRKAGLPLNAPVRLTRGENGRMAIHDPLTGWSADLMGFGADNARAFARLLD